MPELPEVETIRRGLEKYLPGRRIAQVEVRLPKLLRNCDPQTLNEDLQGKEFLQVRRVGKILILDCEDWSLLVRLGMTGQLTFRDLHLPDQNSFTTHAITGLQRAQGQFSPDKHTHIIIRCQDETEVLYRDIRQFGKWYLYSTQDLPQAPELQALGPDPFQPSYTLAYLSAQLAKSRRPIKVVLMDQGVVCGLGNIYADEALFIAAIAPQRAANSLNSEEVGRLYQAILQVLRQGSANRGTTFSDYRDADGLRGGNAHYLQVYGRAGQPCYRCGAILQKMTLGGRTTAWCPHCQH